MPFTQTVSHIHSDGFAYKATVAGQPPGVVITGFTGSTNGSLTELNCSFTKL
ncbi:hypothetical protein [Fulvivirga kasyanovii]|uniref:hypothetical protein n=1 Tax=Fulvivirga kasyanovii TaxID=396812 RepID=UPI0012BC7D91|nr:hypothetical protein [Fulvivirga kasyanovii]